MNMIRVVAQHSPSIFAILGIFDADKLTPQLEIAGHTYYRVETHNHYVLYKMAISGWGAGGATNKTFDKGQR